MIFALIVDENYVEMRKRGEQIYYEKIKTNSSVLMMSIYPITRLYFPLLIEIWCSYYSCLSIRLAEVRRPALELS